VSTGAGLALALLSAFALNWGWIAQHGAAAAMPTMSLRRPVHALTALFGDLSWVVGFVVGLAGWAFYIAALTLAPLSLVQATSAGGIGILAALAHRRGDRLGRRNWIAVAIAVGGLALLGASLAGGAVSGRSGAPGTIAIWLAISAAVAGFACASGGRLAPGAGLGLAAGVLYGAGDVATKGAVFGGTWLLLVPVVLAAHGGAFVALQLAFQRGGSLATAGTASLLTNALPIAAGLAIFHERVPGGLLGIVRVVAFACVVVAAALLARRDATTTPVEAQSIGRRMLTSCLLTGWQRIRARGISNPVSDDVRRQVSVLTAPEIKPALVDYALAEGLSMSDAVVSLLAEEVGFTFIPSGRRLRKRPSFIARIVVVMNSSAIAEVDWAAAEAEIDRQLYINKVLATALGVDFDPRPI
jgi:hypothetical protein